MELSETEHGVVEAMYTAVADEHGFDGLVAACEARLRSVAAGDEAVFASPAVLRHLSRALELVSRPADRGLRDEARPVIELTAGGVVAGANEAASARLGVIASARTNLSWVSPQSRYDLDAVRAGATGSRNRRHAILRLEALDGTACLAEAFVQSPGLVTIRVIEPSWTEATSALLAETFGLTTAECEVARLLTAEGEAAGVAQRRGTSVDTVRTQLKTIFGKTGARNQVELVRMLTLISGQAEAAARPGKPIWRDPLGKERSLTDQSGRRIAYSRMGAENGTPLILLHGMATGYFLPEAIQSRLCAEGLTVYTICRPGFGNSDPAPQGGAVETGARSVLSFMDGMGIDKCPLVGLVSGTIPAVRAAAMAPERVTELVSLGACIPMDDPEARADLPANHRVVLELLEKAPGILELAVAATTKTVQRHGVRFILDRMYSWCEPDRQVLADGEKAARLTASAQMLLAQGPGALMGDIAMLGYGWRDDLRAAGVPLTMLYGDKDPIYKPGAVEAFAARHGQVEPVRLDDCGQLVSYQAAGAVCRALVRAGRG